MIFLHRGKFKIHCVIHKYSLSTSIIFLKCAMPQSRLSHPDQRHPKHRYLCEYPTEIFLLNWLWWHNSGRECNDWNRSENRNQCKSGFKITKFPQKNREFWKSRLLWIPRNVKIWVPSLIIVTYTHQISALGDSSTTRYGVNNIFQRDARTCVGTHVRTESS